MKTKFQVGQIVRFKSSTPEHPKKKAYFIITQLDNFERDLVTQAINSSEYFKSGTTIIPDYPYEDLEIITIKASDLTDHVITIKEEKFQDIVSDRAKKYVGNDTEIIFSKIKNNWFSNVEFNLSDEESPLSCKGALYIHLDYLSPDFGFK